MKKISMAIIALFALNTVAHCQASATPENPNTISVNAGFSLVGLLVGSLKDDGSSTEHFKYSAPPAIQVNFDRQLTKVVSIGAGISFQTMKVDVTGHQYYNQNNDLVTENYNSKINRFNVGIRPLFHYGNIPNFDMYSGLRLGITNWSYSTTSNDPEIETADFRSLHFAPQLILFGMRGYLTDHLGLNIEFAAGAPHYASMGINYRF